MGAFAGLTIFLGLPSLYGKHIRGVNAATMLTATTKKRMPVLPSALHFS